MYISIFSEFRKLSPAQNEQSPYSAQDTKNYWSVSGFFKRPKALERLELS